MPYEYNNPLVERFHRALAGVETDLPKIFGALLTFTEDVIHLVEDETYRQQVETAYVKALMFASAAEEPFHVWYLPTTEGMSEEVFLREQFEKILRRLFVDDNDPHSVIGPNGHRGARPIRANGGDLSSPNDK